MADHRLEVISRHIINAMDKRPNVTSHVLDLSRGKPVTDLRVTLSKFNEDQWKSLKASNTNSDGRCTDLTGSDGIEIGIYKLHFETQKYFESKNQKSFYPYVEITFEVDEPQAHYHVPILLGPYGFTTYKGT